MPNKKFKNKNITEKTMDMIPIIQIVVNTERLSFMCEV